MLKLEVGQVYEFIKPVNVNGQSIAKGTRVRVGFIQQEALEDKVDIVVISDGPSKTLQVPRSLLMMNAQAVKT
jgi:hypothetical protein